MLRLSHFVYTLLLLIVMSSAAFAGHQADYTMKVTMDPAGLAGNAALVCRCNPDCAGGVAAGPEASRSRHVAFSTFAT